VKDGLKIRTGPPAGPGKPAYTYPSLAQRMEAAIVLLSKVVPDLKSSEVTGKDGADLIPKPAPVRLGERQAAFVAGLAYAQASDKARDANGR